MSNDDTLKPDQHYGPLEIWAGEWDQVSHEEWMGVAYTCDLPGKERYIRADRAPVLDEELVDQLRDGVSAAEAAGVPDRDEWYGRRIAHPDQRGMEVHPPGAFVMAWALRDVLKAVERWSEEQNAREAGRR